MNAARRERVLTVLRKRADERHVILFAAYPEALEVYGRLSRGEVGDGAAPRWQTPDVWLRVGLGLLPGTLAILMMVCVKNRVEDKREKRRHMVGLWGVLFWRVLLLEG